MSINRSQDSLSRYEVNSFANLLDLNKPAVRDDVPSLPRTAYRDVLEISKAKLEQDALDSLRHTSKYTVVQRGFMRIGKILFLGVALPPIFLLYKVPKWVAITALPFLFSPIINLWHEIKIIALKQGVYLVKISETLQNVWQSVLLPVSQVISHIKQFGAYINKRAALLWKQLGSKFSQYNFSLPFALFKKSFEGIKKQTYKFALYLKSGIQKVFEQGMDGVVALLDKWKSYKATREDRNPRKRLWKETATEAKKMAQKRADQVVASFKKGVARFKEDISPVITFLTWIWQFFMWLITLVKDQISLYANKVVVFLGEKHHALLIVIKRKSETLKKNVLENTWRNFLKNVMQQKGFLMIPELVRENIKKFLLYSFFFKLSATLFRGCMVMSQKALRGFIFIDEKATEGLKIAYSWMEYPAYFLKMVARGASKVLSTSSKSLTHVLYVSLYYFLLLCMIGWIVSTRKEPVKVT